MRKRREQQSTIFDIFPHHSLGLEYETISRVLDQHPRFVEWVASDLGHGQVKQTGREGLSAETILRAAIVELSRFAAEEEKGCRESEKPPSWI